MGKDHWFILSGYLESTHKPDPESRRPLRCPVAPRRARAQYAHGAAHLLYLHHQPRLDGDCSAVRHGLELQEEQRAAAWFWDGHRQYQYPHHTVDPPDPP